MLIYLLWNLSNMVRRSHYDAVEQNFNSGRKQVHPKGLSKNTAESSARCKPIERLQFVFAN